MKSQRIVLALALAALAAPALAVSETRIPPNDALTAIPLSPLQRGAVPSGGEAARWNFENGWPSKGGGIQRPPASPQITPVPSKNDRPVAPAAGPGPGLRR